MAKKLKPITKAAFLDLMSNMLGLARQNLQTDGFLEMMVVWVTPDGHILLTDSWNRALVRVEQLREQGHHEEAGEIKNAIWKDVREHLEREKAIGYFTISDAWVGMKPIAPGDVAFGEEPGKILIPGLTLPRFMPNRREAIVFTWEWKGPPENVHRSGAIRQFYRQEGNRILFEEIEREGSTAGGAQEGLLR